MSLMQRPISSRDFKRSLTRGERASVRNAATDEMGELRDELLEGVIDGDDQYVRDLVLAIPGVDSVRLSQLLG